MFSFVYVQRDSPSAGWQWGLPDVPWVGAGTSFQNVARSNVPNLPAGSSCRLRHFFVATSKVNGAYILDLWGLLKCYFSEKLVNFLSTSMRIKRNETHFINLPVERNFVGQSGDSKPAIWSCGIKKWIKKRKKGAFSEPAKGPRIGRHLTNMSCSSWKRFHFFVPIVDDGFLADGNSKRKLCLILV